MQKPESLIFKEGKLTAKAAPSWFSPGIKNKPDFIDFMVSIDAKALGEFKSRRDDIDVFSVGPRGYLIMFSNSDSAYAFVFIETVADFLTFKAIYLAPLAQLNMAIYRHDDWEKTHDLGSTA